MTELFDITPALHFVGFRGDEYHSAVRIWGKPDFFHRAWDRWAQQDVHPIDTVIFACRTDQDPLLQSNSAPSTPD